MKWKHQSYAHLSWLSYEELVTDNPPHGKSRFYRFVKMLPRDDSGMIIEYPANTPPEQFYNPNFTEVERVVACSRDININLEDLWFEYAEEIIEAMNSVCINGYYYIDPFMNKVDEERDGAVGYYSIIKKPMWMNLIMQKFENTKKAHNHPEVKVEEGEVYQDATGFFDDIELMFSNCHLYNKDPECGIVIMCSKLEEVYGKKKAAYYERYNEMNEMKVSLTIDGSDEMKY